MFDYRRVLSVEVFRMGPGCFLRREAKRSHQWQDKSAGKFLKNWLFTLGHILHDVYMMWLVEHVWRSQLDVLQIADDEKRHWSRKIPSPSISLIFNNPSMVPNIWLHPLRVHGWCLILGKDEVTVPCLLSRFMRSHLRWVKQKKIMLTTWERESITGADRKQPPENKHRKLSKGNGNGVAYQKSAAYIILESPCRIFGPGHHSGATFARSEGDFRWNVWWQLVYKAGLGSSMISWVRLVNSHFLRAPFLGTDSHWSLAYISRSFQDISIFHSFSNGSFTWNTWKVPATKVRKVRYSPRIVAMENPPFAS